MSDLWGSVSAQRTPIPTGADARAARAAAGQYGVVTRAQLADAGLSRAAIARRVADGRLHRLHRAVYSVGHRALVPDAFRLAAVLACGPSSVLSHRSAADLWGLRPCTSSRVDVTVAGDRGRHLAGIRAHRGRLHPDDVTSERGIPVTTPARTLVDLAALVPRDHLLRALERAEQVRLFDLRALGAVIERAPRRSGAQSLRRALEDLRTAPFTRSELERRALALIARHGLPAPAVNVRVAGYEVDLLWRAARVVVELDGRAVHDTALAFERDRRRDADLQARGYAVVRFTWRQVTSTPDWIVARLVDLLGR